MLIPKTTVLLTFLLAANPGGDDWMTDFEAAKAKAKQENKDLLIDFTGSDWCGWCIRLNKEVFSHDVFKEEVHKHFVLVELDYPSKKKLPDELKAQNERLKTHYNISGYPTIYLTDADGRPYGKTGYKQGGPEKYLEHLAELRKTRAARDEHFNAAVGAEGVERAKHLAAGIDALGANFVPFYTEQVSEIIALDKDGKAGLKGKYEKVLAEIALDKAVQEELAKVNRMVPWRDREAAKEKAPEAVAALEAFLKKQPEAEAKVAGAMANLLAAQEKFDEAIAWLEKLKAARPELAKNIDQGIERMRKMAEQQKAAGEDGEDGEDGR